MDIQLVLIIGAVVVVGALVVIWQQRQGVVKRPSVSQELGESGSPDWLKANPTASDGMAWLQSLAQADWGKEMGFTPEQVAQIHADLGRGRKINAIKLYREVTGVGLKEAKEAVEAIQERQQLALSGYQSPAANLPRGDVMAQIEEELRAKRKINAIKLYREAYKVGLKEAKDAVDVMERNLGM